MPLLVEYHHHLDPLLENDLEKLYVGEPSCKALHNTPIDTLNQALVCHDFRFYGGVFNARMVCGALVVLHEGLATLDFLCVREATRRRDVGSTLLNEIKRCETARRTTQLNYAVAADNKPAQAFLSANGFYLESEKESIKLYRCELDPD